MGTGLLNCHCQCHYYANKEMTFNIPIKDNRINIEKENNKLNQNLFETIDRKNIFFDNKKFSCTIW